MMLQFNDDGVLEEVNEEKLVQVDEDDLNKLMEEYNKLSEKNEELKKENEQLKHDLNNSDGTIENLSEDYQKLLKENKEFKKENEQLKNSDTITDLETEIMQLKEESKQLKSKLDDANGEIRHCHMIIDTLVANEDVTDYNDLLNKCDKEILKDMGWENV